MEIDFSKELAQLMMFTGDTATAIRMYSAYSNGGPSSYLHRTASPEQESIELMFLADALHHLGRLGSAIRSGDLPQIVDVSEDVLEAFMDYATERPERGLRQAKPTFDVWAEIVSLADARDAITGIRNKAAAVISAG